MFMMPPPLGTFGSCPPPMSPPGYPSTWGSYSRGMYRRGTRMCGPRHYDPYTRMMGRTLLGGVAGTLIGGALGFIGGSLIGFPYGGVLLGAYGASMGGTVGHMLGSMSATPRYPYYW